jgi:hypothetical protein
VPVKRTRLFDRVCTIYCLVAPDDLTAALGEAAAPFTIRATPRARWRDAILRADGVELRLHRSRFVRPGFRGPAGVFNKVILGTATYFRDGRATPARARVLTHVERTLELVGCVCEPEFDAAAHAAVFAIAGATDGMIFDGQSMLDPRRRAILTRRAR